MPQLKYNGQLLVVSKLYVPFKIFIHNGPVITAQGERHGIGVSEKVFVTTTFGSLPETAQTWYRFQADAAQNERSNTAQTHRYTGVGGTRTPTRNDGRLSRPISAKPRLTVVPKESETVTIEKDAKVTLHHTVDFNGKPAFELGAELRIDFERELLKLMHAIGTIEVFSLTK